MNAPIDARGLAQRLDSDHYGRFFNYLQREDVIDKVWGEPNCLDLLEQVIKDEQASMKARFLACEVLFERHFIFIEDVGSALAADIYVYALAHNLTGMANSWGLLYAHKDHGPVGIRFSMIGDAAVPGLKRLLNSDAQNMTYAGSEEATVGNAYQFRLKDYAAFYISQMKMIPFEFHPDPAQRDEEIEKLKAALA